MLFPRQVQSLIKRGGICAVEEGEQGIDHRVHVREFVSVQCDQAGCWGDVLREPPDALEVRDRLGELFGRLGTLRSPHDERVWIVGDPMDNVSPLFGAYPKTAHIAADLGAAAAAQIGAALHGARDAAPAALPRSLCHVWLDAEPAEQLILDASFRRRGDGLIVQSVRQTDNPQPRDEDLQWARELMAQRLGVSLG